MKKEAGREIIFKLKKEHVGEIILVYKVNSAKAETLDYLLEVICLYITEDCGHFTPFMSYLKTTLQCYKHIFPYLSMKPFYGKTTEVLFNTQYNRV